MGIFLPDAFRSSVRSWLVTYCSEAVLKPFAASRRTEIEFIGADTSAAMLERLRAERNDPKADVVIMDASTALTACAEGLVEPINPRLLQF